MTKKRKIDIEYEVVWTDENGRMKDKQFRYETEKSIFPLTSNLPDDVYVFYKELQNKKFDVAVFAGELKETGTGLVRCTGLEPVYD